MIGQHKNLVQAVNDDEKVMQKMRMKRKKSLVTMKEMIEDIVILIDNDKKLQIKMLNDLLRSFAKSMEDLLLLDIVVMVLVLLNDFYYLALTIRVFGLLNVRRARKRILLRNSQNG